MKKGLTGQQIIDTWNRVMECDEKEYARLARKSGPFQEDLSAFVVVATQNLPPDVGQHAREMMVGLYEVYREHAVSVRVASEDEVMKQWKESRARITEIEALVEAGRDITTLLVRHPQRALMTLILGILMDVDPDDEDGLWTGRDEERLNLEDDEFWHLLAVMHTVVAVLDSHATFDRSLS